MTARVDVPETSSPLDDVSPMSGQVCPLSKADPQVVSIDDTWCSHSCALPFVFTWSTEVASISGVNLT